ncbi:MAG: McrC family protein [Bacteroidales bacterium]|nr:McrC family protein [Bacteroidales bacterium]
MEHDPWGYYASYVIGAEWIDEKEALVVTTKRGMEEIDFLTMFMTCFSSDLSVESFAEIYNIDSEAPNIHAPSLKGVLSPLIVLHFLGVVSRIKSLRKGYVHYSENLKKVKGHIQVMKNERKNIASKRFDRVFCDFDEYTVDIPENRLIKKALLFSSQILRTITEKHSIANKAKLMLSKSLALFENVTDEVQIKEVSLIKGHKLFSEYNEAVRLAKIILQRYDYSISKTSSLNENVPPFTLDMSLLYEHYVYGLLNEAYGDKISYQFKGKTGFPDFLYCSTGFKAILDTKYIPKYERSSLDNNVIRQLSGYSRDIPILRHLGYEDIDEEAPIPNVPCIIIYPKEGNKVKNPFVKKKLRELCTTPVRKLARFYKICIPLPVMGSNIQ